MQDIPCFNTTQGIFIEGRWRFHCIVGVEVGRILDSIQEGIMRKNVDYKYDGGYFVWRGIEYCDSFFVLL